MSETVEAGHIWHFMSPETMNGYGPWVRHADYAAQAARIEAQQAEIDRLREAAEKAARFADGIRGAVETNQIADKDVRGVAIAIRDDLRGALKESQS